LRFASFDGFNLVRNLGMQGRGKDSRSGKKAGSGDLFSQIKGWHLWLALFVGLGVAAFLALRAMQTAYTVVPSKVFSENFTDKLTDIKDLEGGGEISSYFNLYLKFRAPHGAHPKHYTNYRDEFATQAQRYFQDIYPHDDELTNANDLELSSHYEHESASSVICCWLLHYKKSDLYYFRTWGQQ
jgi:hypothetical protein